VPLIAGSEGRTKVMVMQPMLTMQIGESMSLSALNLFHFTPVTYIVFTRKVNH